MQCWPLVGSIKSTVGLKDSIRKVNQTDLFYLSESIH